MAPLIASYVPLFQAQNPNPPRQARAEYHPVLRRAHRNYCQYSDKHFEHSCA